MGIYDFGKTWRLHLSADFFMGEQFATVGGRETFLDLADEPLVVVHKTLDGLVRQHLGIAAALSRKTVRLGLHIRIEMDFHTPNRC